MINNNKRIYHLAFSHFQKIGPKNLQRLENYFPDLATAFHANYFDLANAGLSAKLRDEFLKWRPSFSLEKALHDLDKNHISFITWNDKSYPQILKEIYSPPPILYFKGLCHGENKNRLAVVGSRKHSAYGEKIITELLPLVIKYEIEIISGLALGIDSLAHKITLKNKGLTTAVLGSGLDSNSIYPRENIFLAKKIIESGGTIISEFPPGTPPLKQNFPQRNRIIAGLSQATLVIESKSKSGALITAHRALEQNREVAAVPGNIFSIFSAGPNNLIASGAKSILNAEDILSLFKIEISNLQEINSSPLKNKNNLNYQAKNKAEKLIISLLLRAKDRGERIDTNEIIKNSKLDTALINSTLSILEMKKIILTDKFGYYLK
jgi:DNA processing protein